MSIVTFSLGGNELVCCYEGYIETNKVVRSENGKCGLLGTPNCGVLLASTFQLFTLLLFLGDGR